MGRAKRCFKVTLTNETHVRLGYRCKLPSKEQALNSILRRSVAAQTDAVRQPGKPEVDHAGAWPFDRLKRVWMARTGFTRRQLLASKRSVDGGVQVLGQPFLSNWRAFHAAKADLRATTHAAHAAKTRAAHIAARQKEAAAASNFVAG